jgi:hemerythrin
MTVAQFILWKDEQHSVSNAEIDGQHKLVFDLLNRMYRTMQDSDSKANVLSILDDLKDYAATHFRREEDLMQKGGFPKLSDHKVLHLNYENKVQELRRQFDQSFNDVFRDVFVFLRDWWLNHIQTADRKYIPYISDQAGQ